MLFGRYAFPPNERGYCGPDRAAELLERVDAGASGPALAEVARGFDGAWPYLELIGECLGRDPLDPAVVQHLLAGRTSAGRVAAGAPSRTPWRPGSGRGCRASSSNAWRRP